MKDPKVLVVVVDIAVVDIAGTLEVMAAGVAGMMSSKQMQFCPWEWLWEQFELA